METGTYEDKDAIHVVLQGLNASLVAALGFISIERPERVGAAIKVPYHADFFRFPVSVTTARPRATIGG